MMRSDGSHLVLQVRSPQASFPRYYHCKAVKATFKANNARECFNALEMGAIEVSQRMYESLQHTYSVESKVNSCVNLKSEQTSFQPTDNGFLDTLSKLHSIWDEQNSVKKRQTA